jgi:hypothetical protein
MSENTGQRAGKETVILYLRDEVATLSPAGKRVKRFAKVALEPGQSKTLTFRLNREDFSFIGADNKPVVEARAILPYRSAIKRANLLYGNIQVSVSEQMLTSNNLKFIRLFFKRRLFRNRRLSSENSIR